jgi:two-component system cell cycle sensor histidine kinase PleC
MRALQLFHLSEGSLLADYASIMSEQLIRRRAELDVRAARAEAESAIRARSEFLANMNHELRTPLNAIMGFATMLGSRDDYNIGEEQRIEYAEYILQSADLLLGHINTILEVAALESGGVELSSQELDLGKLLTEAVARASVRAKAAGVELTRKDDGDEILAWGDETRFGQAVDHILQAAINACGEGDRILVRASRDDSGRPEIAVRDEGEGLSDEEVADALDVFAEAHRGLDRAFSGPGVGYAIAKTFVEMQGGQFHIKSRKGRGTCVCLALPQAEESAAALKAEDEAGVEDSDAA